MRRFHNPRYAPESLERKLSPSGVVAIPVAAEIYVPTLQTSNTTPVTPLIVSSQCVASCNSGASQVLIVTPTASPDGSTTGNLVALDGPTTPGAPEPTSPVVPTGGTDPAPPPGNGDPPTGTPSIPGGPSLPA
jgi:hypothetical protein